jgi:nucleoside 2-deoxyribosyltransferase
MTDMETKPRIFLSFSGHDRAAASAASQVLQDGGCDVFSAYDTTTPLKVGDVQITDIQEGLKKTDAVVLLASNDAVHSQWAAFELGAATALGKPMYVVVSGGLPLPVFLQQTRIVQTSELPKLARMLRSQKPAKPRRAVKVHGGA